MKILSSEDGKAHCDRLTPSDTNLASCVEAENCNESTNKKVFEERITEVWEEKIKDVYEEKIKKDKHFSNNRGKSKKCSTRIYHITWDGFVEEECETVGHICRLCEEDLSFAQVDANEYDEYRDLIDGPQNYPEVSILPCGHCFHKTCLDQTTPEDNRMEPICLYA